MPPKVTQRWVPVNKPGKASTSRGSGGAGGGGVDPAADRLSVLPDALLHHIMSFMKAWEAVRTCVLSRRWRDLWASAPCIDVRLGRHSDADEDYPKFVYRLLLAREVLAPVDTLRLRSPGEDDDFDDADVNMWIHHAINRKARVIQLHGHLHDYTVLNHMSFVSCHLKVLKLSYAELDDKLLRQLSYRCPSLEELQLKSCDVVGSEIVSASLKSLTMVKCKFTINLSVDAPNLVFLQCNAPGNWVPLFKYFGALVTGSVMLDDSSLSCEFQKFEEEDEFAQTSDEDDDDDSIHFSRHHKHVASSNDSDGFNSDDWYSDNYSGGYSDDVKDDYDYGSDINSDSDTYEYSEIANGFEDKKFGNHDDGHGCKSHDCNAKYLINDYEKLGGQNALHNLANARNLALLGHSGEVVLRREAMSCPTFSNLKNLALGEWCISAGADFHILILLLQHSPKLEKLFLQLEMNLDIQKALGGSINSKGGLFACKHLSMVKIRCTKDDPRVHMLAQMFRYNNVPLEKIYVHRSGSYYLRNLKLERSFVISELESRPY